jgi:hypothetical protein
MVYFSAHNCFYAGLYRVCLGYTATDMNGYTAPGRPEDAAKILAHYAMLDEEGPSGQFFNAAGALPW